MREWLEKLAGPEYASAVLWTLLALVALVIVLIIVRIVRSLTAGTFVVGGRNRKTRLAVMDATAVDNHRRLVLVRRDDVEHLILIGGPTDVVVERDIRVGAAPRRSAPGAQQQQMPRPRPPEPPQHHTPAANATPVAAPPLSPPPAAAPPTPPVPAFVPRENPRPVPAPLQPQEVRAEPAPRPSPPRQPPPAAPAQPPQPAQVRAAPSYPQPPAPRPTTRDDIDAALMKELEVSLDEAAPKVAGPASLDDEMTKLLGELSSKKR